MKRRAWQLPTSLSFAIVFLGMFLAAIWHTEPARAADVTGNWVNVTTITIGGTTYTHNDGWEFVEPSFPVAIGTAATMTQADCQQLAGHSRVRGFSADRTSAERRNYTGAINRARPAPEACEYNTDNVTLTGAETNSDTSGQWVDPTHITVGGIQFTHIDDAWEFVSNGFTPAEGETPDNIECNRLTNVRRLTGFNEARDSATMTIYSGAGAVGNCTVRQEVTVTLTGVENSDTGGEAGGGASDGPECTTGNGIGGVVALALCPAVAAATAGIESIANNIILPYLVVSPLTTQSNDGEDSPAYSVWKSVRNLANVAFIVAFLFIIFAQSTSLGLSNYGIKKMLGGLFIAVVGANLSYFLLAFAIDIFNILGGGIASIADLVVGGTTAGGEGGPGVGEGVAAAVLGLGIGAGIIGGIALVGSALLWIGPLVLLAFGFLLFTAILVLGRNLIIIAMAMFSPIPFVLALFPGGQGLAKKYRQFLFKLLIMYPIVIGVITAGKILSQIIASDNLDLTGHLLLLHMSKGLLW